MSELTSDRPVERGGLPGLFDRLQKFLPARLRRGTAVVPVVRLSGVIGAVTPLRPGMTLAGVAKMLERAFATQQRQGGGAGDQFAGRLAGAVAPDLSADPAARGGKETAGAGVRRGCRGVRRLHDRLRGRRDFLRSVVDPRIDRRGRRQLRLSGTDQEDRRRAQALYVPASTRRCSIRSCRRTPTTSRG